MWHHLCMAELGAEGAFPPRVSSMVEEPVPVLEEEGGGVQGTRRRWLVGEAQWCDRFQAPVGRWKPPEDRRLEARRPLEK